MTHMDYNISAALHLASRGEGYLYNETGEVQITTRNLSHLQKKYVKSGARIILSGLGADEVFGGYSRYRVAFLRAGFSELHNEMTFGNQLASSSNYFRFAPLMDP